LEKVLTDLQKSKIDTLYLTKFILFLKKDLSDEFKIFNSDGFDLIGAKKDFGIDYSDSKNYLEDSLLMLKVNEGKLNKLHEEILEYQNHSKKQTDENVTQVKDNIQIQWKGYDSDLYYL
jgi:hypothetical protein